MKKSITYLDLLRRFWFLFLDFCARARSRTTRSERYSKEHVKAIVQQAACFPI